MGFAHRIRIGALPLLGAWLGCNAIVGLEPGTLKETGSGGGAPVTSSSTSTSTSSAATGTGGAGGTGTGGADGTGGAGGTGGADCISCGEFLEEPGELCGDEDPVEPGSSAEIWDTLFGCACDTGGACEVNCTDTLCLDLASSDECLACVADAIAGCGAAYEACQNDACALGVPDPFDCATACAAIYDCGALECDGVALCQFSGDPAEKAVYVDDATSGCMQLCMDQPLLVNLVDTWDCAQTIDTLKGAVPSFANDCENGISAPCALSPGDDACTTCTKTSCCDEITACFADPACAACSDCLQMGDPITCITGGTCDFNDPVQGPLLTCWQDNCLSDCM